MPNLRILWLGWGFLGDGFVSVVCAFCSEVLVFLQFSMCFSLRSAVSAASLGEDGCGSVD
jgi:hypothetical protein